MLLLLILIKNKVNGKCNVNLSILSVIVANLLCIKKSHIAYQLLLISYQMQLHNIKTKTTLATLLTVLLCGT